MDRLLSDPQQTAAMGLAGRKHLEDDFNQQRWLREIAIIYDDLIAGR